MKNRKADTYIGADSNMPNTMYAISWRIAELRGGRHWRQHCKIVLLLHDIINHLRSNECIVGRQDKKVAFEATRVRIEIVPHAKSDCHICEGPFSKTTSNRIKVGRVGEGSCFAITSEAVDRVEERRVGESKVVFGGVNSLWCWWWSTLALL